MSFHLKDDFQKGTPVAAVGAGWFNAVASFLNALTGGLGIKVHKSSRPSVSAPVTIDIDPDAVAKAIAKKETLFKTLETPTATLDVYNQIPAAHMSNGQMVLLPNTDANKWTRGEVDQDGKMKGVKVYLPTENWDSGVRNCLAWRLCEFDCYGHLQAIGAQTILTYSCSAEQLA